MGYISPLAQKPHLVDGFALNLAQLQWSLMITCDNFFGDLLRYVDTVGVEFCLFSLTCPVAFNIRLVLPCNR